MPNPNLNTDAAKLSAADKEFENNIRPSEIAQIAGQPQAIENLACDLYTKFLNSFDYFTTEVITDEDKMRGNLYVTERLRKEQEKSFSSKEDFLKELHLELYIHENDKLCLPRLAQLTEKTNQFNILKHPLTESEIEAFATSGSHFIWHGRLEDIFCPARPDAPFRH